MMELRTAAGQACLMAFDRANPAAIDWANTRAATLITEVTDETRLAVREVTGRAIAEGIPPRQAAKLIKEMVGLRVDQVNAVLNLRLRLVTAGIRAEKTGRMVRVPIPGMPGGVSVPPGGLTQARLDSLLKKYADRQLRQRALMIARTETIAASNAGQQLLWQQAVAEGLLRGTEMQRWTVANDERLCKLCRPLAGQTVPLGAPFMTALGPVYAPPLHPNCRCGVVLSIPTRRR